MAQDARPALEVLGLSLSYNGRPALTDVSFSVSTGARVAVVGPNGAGKSTLFKGLVGLVRVVAGEVRFGGLPAAQGLAQVAYVPQREEIDWSFPVTVLDVVLMGRYGKLGLWRRPGRADHALARQLLAEMGIAELAERPLGDLSGGEQQRVFLARALAQEPRLLLLDEPFAGVDAPTQETTLALFDRLREQQVTLLVSTHDLELAVAHFDRVLLLNRRLIAYGPPADVLTPECLAEAFGAPTLLVQNGGRYLALTNRLCPPERSETARGRGDRR